MENKQRNLTSDPWTKDERRITGKLCDDICDLVDGKDPSIVFNVLVSAVVLYAAKDMNFPKLTLLTIVSDCWDTDISSPAEYIQV